MDITCLVHRGPSSYVLTVGGDHKMDDLMTAMAAHSSLRSVGSDAILQVHNKTFETFVNIDENTTLENRCVIRVLDVCITADGPTTSTMEDGSLNSSSSSDTPMLDEIVETYTGPQYNKRMLPFVFPKTPLDISARLSLCKDSQVPECLRKRIIHWLWFELSQYTLYPGNLYESVARELVQRYPQLKDGFGEGHLTWQTILKYKAKNTRKKLPAGIRSVEEMREKAKKRIASYTCENSQAKVAKSQTRKSSWNLSFDGEDEKSLQAHIEIMKKEVRAAGGNADQIKESMDKTFHRRRTYIEFEKPTLQNVLQCYPALGLERELLNEFHRLTGIHAKEAISNVVKNYGQRILALVPHSKRTLEVEDPEDAYHCTVAVLMSVPRLVKEHPSAIIAQLVPGETQMYPKILHSASHPETSSALLVSFESLQLTAVDIVDSFALLMAVFWAFNVQYTPRARRTCLLLEALMGLQPSAFAPSTVKAATAVMKVDD